MSTLNWDGYTSETPVDKRTSTTRWSHGFHSHRTNLVPKWRHLLPNTLLFLIACGWLSLTVWLTSVSSSDHPPNVFNRPEWTVFILTLLSNGTVFLMRELHVGTYELLRWTLISRPAGVGMATFLSLSRATSFTGAISLFFSDQQTNHRRWCSQRLLQILIVAATGIVLLSNISIVTSFIQTGTTQDIVAGLGPFNPNVTQDIPIADLRLVFMAYTLGFLNDRTSVTAFPPSTPACTANDTCLSILLPGGLYRTVPSPYNLSSQEGGTIYIVENARAYHLEFTYGPSDLFQWSDCQIYPVQSSALAFCATNVDDDLFVGWRPCPLDLAAKGHCNGTGIWNSYNNATVQLHVSSVNVTTAYSLRNSSILSSISQVPPTTVRIPAEGIASVAGRIWNVTDKAPENMEELAIIIRMLHTNSLPITTGAITETDILRSFITFLLYFASDPLPSTPLYHGYVARETYRIIISTYSQYLFAVLGCITVIWCGILLVYCGLTGVGPNLSLFPEVDFATKVHVSEGMPKLLAGTKSGTSSEIKERIKGEMVYVGSVPADNG